MNHPRAERECVCVTSVPANLFQQIIRHVIVRCMQEVKAVHDKVRNGHNMQLPNKLADSDNTGRALEEHVALIPKNVHVTLRAVAQSPSTAMAPTQDIWETVSPHPETQECTHAASTERLLQQRTWAVEALWPSKPPLIRALGSTLRRARPRADINTMPDLASTRI